MQNSMDEIKRIPALTGVRFVAALMVFFSHYPLLGINDTLTRTMLSGYAGVTFFFILSGFILTYNYLGRFERNPTSSIPEYLWSRFTRVYPLYIFLMIFMWIKKGGDDQFLIYALAAQAWSSSASVAYGLNPPAWSISVEAFLYASFIFVIPALIKLKVLESKHRILFLALIIIATQLLLAAIFSRPEISSLPLGDAGGARRWLYIMPINRILDFMLGILGAAFYMKHSHSLRMEKLTKFMLYASMVVVAALMASKQNYVSAFSWDAAYAAPFAIS